MKRRIGIVALTLAVGLVGTAAAQNTGFPAKPIRIIVTTPAGSGADFFARTLAQGLSEIYKGVAPVVENRPGAGGIIGAREVASAAPDGYTLGVASTAHVVAPLLQVNPPYKPLADFTPIAQLTALPFILVAAPTVPAKTLPELVTALKADPRKYNFGSLGNGTAAHLGAEIFNAAAGVEVVHVPFKGASDLYTALISGEVHYSALFVPTAGVLRSGRARVLAVTGKTRNAALPDVPTVGEQGLPGAEAEALMGIVAPAGMPPELVRKLHADIVSVLRKPETREKFATQSGEPTPDLSPTDYAAKLKAEYELYQRLLPRIGLKP
jgi:tripartite-type tricarboxylate transporter receptor subunit TctC